MCVIRRYEQPRCWPLKANADRWFCDQLAEVFVSTTGRGAALNAAASPPGANEIMTIRTPVSMIKRGRHVWPGSGKWWIPVADS